MFSVGFHSCWSANCFFIGLGFNRNWWLNFYKYKKFMLARWYFVAIWCYALPLIHLELKKLALTMLLNKRHCGRGILIINILYFSFCSSGNAIKFLFSAFFRHISLTFYPSANVINYFFFYRQQNKITKKKKKKIF